MNDKTEDAAGFYNNKGCGMCGGEKVVDVSRNGIKHRIPCPECATSEAVEGEVVSPVENTPQSFTGNLPTIPMPPAGAIQSAFFTMIKYKSVGSAIEAYNGAITALGDTEAAKRYYLAQRTETDRVASAIDDIDTILAGDKADREAALRASNARKLREELAEEEATFQLKMKKIQWQRELAEAEGQKNKLDESDEEFLDALRSTMKRHDWADLVEQEIKSKGYSKEKAEEFRKAAQKIMEDSFT